MLKGKWPSLAALCAAQVLALSLWFSATAIVPSLRETDAIDAFSASLFTSAVQAGFVVGTLVRTPARSTSTAARSIEPALRDRRCVAVR